MRKYLRLLSIFLFLSAVKLFSQSEGALTFTTLQVSPLLNGSGRIGTAIPNEDILGFYLNPAILGYSSEINHVSTSFMLQKTRLPSYSSSYYSASTFGINLGINAKSFSPSLPLRIGLAFIHNKFDYSANQFNNASYSMNTLFENSYDLFNSLSLGVGFDYFFDMNFGFSVKFYESNLGVPINNEDIPTASADGVMFDFGTLLIFPISKMYLDDYNLKINESSYIKPNFQFSFGYSLTNLGNKLYYIDKSQADPLSRTERLGYSLEVGIDLFLKNKIFKIISYSFSAETEDLLISYNSINQTDYQNLLSDFNFIDHLVQLESDDKIIIHKGHVVEFLNSLTLTSGSYFGSYNGRIIKTIGMKFSSDGIFKLINSFSENKIIDYITAHLKIEYVNSNIELSSLNSIEYNLLSFHFIRFEI